MWASSTSVPRWPSLPDCLYACMLLVCMIHTHNITLEGNAGNACGLPHWLICDSVTYVHYFAILTPHTNICDFTRTWPWCKILVLKFQRMGILTPRATEGSIPPLSLMGHLILLRNYRKKERKMFGISLDQWLLVVLAYIFREL